MHATYHTHSILIDLITLTTIATKILRSPHCAIVFALLLFGTCLANVLSAVLEHSQFMFLMRMIRDKKKKKKKRRTRKWNWENVEEDKEVGGEHKDLLNC
jgi:hypothetical protein